MVTFNIMMRMMIIQALMICLRMALSDATSTATDITKFEHFTAHSDTQTCSRDVNATPFNTQIRGVNLGGWMVLEPWITPSLFYQFLGHHEEDTAVDQYSFCDVLGPEEGNKQLRRHWETWVTEDIIKQLAESNAVNSLRLPVGDWMYKPYGPYIGCTDGALDYVDKVLDWAHENGLSVLFDIHALRGSQNGNDNSGRVTGFEWTSKHNQPFSEVTFQHWPVRTAEWIGTFDKVSRSYTDIKHDNIQHSLDVIEAMATRYGDHPGVLGLQPVNKPWEFTPTDVLKKFYWDGYLKVKEHAPSWKYIMHDSGLFKPDVWGGFMDGCPDRVLDTHIYTAWDNPSTPEQFYDKACSTKNSILELERAFGPVIVGEWSLATDNCAMWLNGFNDNIPGYPKLPCNFIPCAAPYMGTDQPGTPVDPTKAAQGPHGTGISTPVFGQCPVDRDWHKQSAGNYHDTILSPDAPYGHDASDDVMKNLAQKKINAFSGFGHGWYFWNFRTELNEPRWSFMLALEKKWIPKGNLSSKTITNACHKENNGLYNCIARRDRPESSVRNGIEYVLSVDGSDLGCTNGATFDMQSIQTMTGADLYLAADCAYTYFWKRQRVEGATTCDFGGTAVLVEVHQTYIESSDVMAEEWKIAQLISIALFGVLFGGFVGFVIAMRLNRHLNARVYNSSLGEAMKRNPILKRSFGELPTDYGSVDPPKQSMMVSRGAVYTSVQSRPTDYKLSYTSAQSDSTDS